MRIRFLIFLCVLCLAGCNTYYDPFDSYLRGLRFFDRGDYSTAAMFWQPLADNGDCDAQYRYGHLLWLGLGVKMDKKAAEAMWEKAANGGQAKAQIAMGNLALDAPHNIYQCRDGCTPDAAAAYKWYLLARKDTHYEGERAQLNLLIGDARSKLSESDQARVEHLADLWKPFPKSCEPRNLF